MALDSTIERYASDNDMVVVSKDEDFYFLASSPRSVTRLVWVRMGNCRTPALIEAFEAQLPHIIAALEAGSRIVELR